MSFTTLGKRNYTVLRHVIGLDGEITGKYIDGEWVEASGDDLVEYNIRANIQPSMASYRTQLLPEGDRNKEAITIYSNDWLYTSRSGNCPALDGDIILYRGGKWEVVVSRPYGNFGEHCEALAIKKDDSLIPRIDGDIEKIN